MTTNGQQVQEKMVHVTCHQGDPDQTTVRCHLTPVRTATIKKTKGKCWEDVEKREPSALLVGLQMHVAPVENSIEGPQIIKSRATT